METQQQPQNRRYVMRSKLMSIGDDYWIEDDQGRKAYRVDGKAMHLRKTFLLEDASGREVAKIQERKLSIRDKMAIERDGKTVATVRTAFGWGDRFSIETAAGVKLKAKGKLGDHEFKIERDGEVVAQVSKKWLRVRDSYGVEIRGSQDDALLLSAVVAIEEMAKEDKAEE